MAKYEIEKRVRTPDGVDHPSVEAADAHMKSVSVNVLAAATIADLHNAIAGGQPLLRSAIRDVYLQVWPRAPRGSKTAASASAAPSAPPATEPASEAPSALVAEVGTSDPSPAIVHDISDPDMEPPAPTHEFSVHATHEVSHDFAEAAGDHQAPAHQPARSRKKA